MNRLWNLSVCCLLPLAILTCGCQSAPMSGVAPAVRQLPADARQHVHVIFVDSPVDAMQVGDIPGISEYVRCNGIPNVHYYNAYSEGSGSWISEKIRCIRRSDPCAKIMVVGWSYGTLIALQALEEIECEGLCIDTLVHLDSCVLDFTNQGARPRNVRRVVLIYRSNNEPSNIPFDALYLVEENFHLRLPKKRRAMDALMTEIWRLTGYLPGQMN